MNCLLQANLRVKQHIHTHMCSMLEHGSQIARSLSAIQEFNIAEETATPLISTSVRLE